MDKQSIQIFKIICPENMISGSLSKKLHFSLFFLGLLNWTAIYYYSAFLNKIAILLGSSAQSIVALL